MGVSFGYVCGTQVFVCVCLDKGVVFIFWDSVLLLTMDFELMIISLEYFVRWESGPTTQLWGFFKPLIQTPKFLCFPDGLDYNSNQFQNTQPICREDAICNLTSTESDVALRSCLQASHRHILATGGNGFWTRSAFGLIQQAWWRLGKSTLTQHCLFSFSSVVVHFEVHEFIIVVPMRVQIYWPIIICIPKSSST